MSARGLLPLLVLVSVGILLLKGVAEQPPGDRRVSAANGAPEGWLALAELLSTSRPTDRWTELGWPTDDRGAVWILPPPELRRIHPDEGERLLDLVRAHGHTLVVVCADDEARRSKAAPLFEQLGLTCVDDRDDARDEAIRGTVPAWDVSGRVLGPGRVLGDDRSVWLPLVEDPDGQPVVLERLVALDEGGDEDERTAADGDGGRVVAIGSPSLWANDRIAIGDAARLALSLVPAPRPVRFLEGHHLPLRSRSVGQALLEPGPRSGLLALVLLVPLAWMRLLPRPGSGPRPDDEPEPLAAIGAIAGLASMYRRAEAHPASGSTGAPGPIAGVGARTSPGAASSRRTSDERGPTTGGAPAGDP